MGGSFVSTLARWGAFAALSAVVTVTGSARAVPADIDHLLVRVFDQMRPDYVDRFNLQHFKEVRAESRNYPAAYVGHLGSQTVVSHLVIPTGLLPRELPWQDNVMVDARGVLGKAGAVTASVSWVVGDHMGLQFDEPFEIRRLSEKKPMIAPAKWLRPAYLEGNEAEESPWDPAWNSMSVDELRSELEGYLKR